jgi:glycosyltransferase involved in cell wall biosynthesis
VSSVLAPALGTERPSPARPVFAIGLHSGLLVRHDAISHSARLKLETLRAWQRAGAPIEVRAFANGSDLGDSDVWVGHMGVDYLHRLQRLALNIFEFGIWYDLFDAVFALPPERLVAVYHNITPPALLDDPGARRSAARGLDQKHNLAHVAHIACDSPFNRDDLLGFGLPSDRLSVLPLPTSRSLSPGPPIARRGRPGEPVELLFVSRLVRSKGILDLLDAVDGLDPMTPAVRLTIAGNIALSDAAVVAEVATRAASSGGRLCLAGRIDDRELEARYRASDALILPSYHEGYCVPVLEALAARCPVITSDAGNLPGLLGGLGWTVAAGDVVALRAAIATHARRVVDARDAGAAAVIATSDGDRLEDEWRSAVAKRLQAFSRQAFDDALRDVIAGAARRIGDDASRELLRWLDAKAG